MSARYRGVVVGAAVMAWATIAVAQERSTEILTRPGDYDTYMADEAQSDVVEFPGNLADRPQPVTEAARAYADAAPAEPQCSEYREAVVAHGRTRPATGRACQQPDGSWRIVKAPSLARNNDDFDDRPPLPPRVAPLECRDYQQTIYTNGRAQRAVGRACLQPDGSWRVVISPAVGNGQRHVTSASARAAEDHDYAPRVYTVPRRTPLYDFLFGSRRGDE